MIDLSILPARLPPIRTEQGPINIERIGMKHTESLCEAGQVSAQHVKPWLGASLCPVTIAATKQCINALDSSRHQNYGITYLMLKEDRCLGMGIINYLHPLHLTANLGYWIRSDACGQGLAVALCQSLIKLAFSQMNLHRLECFIEPNNKASLRVVDKLGAEKEGLCRKRIFGRDALLYSITA